MDAQDNYQDKHEDKQQRGVNSIETGIAILRALAAAGHPCSLKQIAADCGITASKAHGYLVSFLRAGMVTQDSETSKYGFGRDALLIGLSALQQLDIMDASKSDLMALRDGYHHTVSLSVWGNRGPTVVRWLDGDRPMLTDRRIGAVLSVLWSTVGRVFLAYLERDEAVRTLVEAEFGTGSGGKPIDWTWVDEILKPVRAEGSAVRDAVPGDLDLHQQTRAISAPVFRFDGQIEAVVTLVGAARAIDLAPESPIRLAVKTAADRISHRIGFKG